MMKAIETTTTPVRNGVLYPLSVEAYHLLGEAGCIEKNSELLYGLVYRKVPKSPIHAVLIALLLEAFESLRKQGFWVRSEQPIVCGDSEPEPDVSVIRGNPRDFTSAHPSTAELVIEVCVTSHEYDRSKLRAYATAGVKEVWLVLNPEKQVEVYRSPAAGAFLEKSVHNGSGELRSENLQGVAVDLDSLFRR